MMHEFECTIVAMMLICGLNSQVTRPSETPGKTSQHKKTAIWLSHARRTPLRSRHRRCGNTVLRGLPPKSETTIPVGLRRTPPWSIYDGKWHVFMTVKLPNRSAIEYCSFENWADADSSPRTILEVSESDYSALRRSFTSHRTRSGISFTKWVFPVWTRCGSPTPRQLTSPILVRGLRRCRFWTAGWRTHAQSVGSIIGSSVTSNGLTYF